MNTYDSIILDELRFHLAQLRDGSDDERYRAALEIRSSGSSHPEVVQALANAIYDDNGHVRIIAAETLSRMGQKAQDAVPVLITVLEVADSYHVSNRPAHLKSWHRMAVAALGNFGPQAKPATESLIKALFDFDKNVSGYAALSLGKIGATEALPALEKALEAEKMPECRSAIAEAIELLKNKSGNGS
jgi:HEAT repeat protein